MVERQHEGRFDLFGPGAMMQAPGQLRDVIRASNERFWESQDRMLDSFLAFASEWVDRRHAGAQDARQCAQQMIEARTPMEMAQACQAWAAGSMERMAADGLAWQRHMMGTAAGFAGPAIESGRRAMAEGERVMRRTVETASHGMEHTREMARELGEEAAEALRRTSEETYRAAQEAAPAPRRGAPEPEQPHRQHQQPTRERRTPEPAEGGGGKSGRSR